MGNVVSCNINKICPYCDKPFMTSNKRKIYCTQRCNRLAYIQRRYDRDAAFKERMRDSWRKYGMDLCPKCGRSKKKNHDICDACRGVAQHIDIRSMAMDDESLFGNPESMVRMEVIMVLASHPEYTGDEIYAVVMDVLELNVIGIKPERIRELVVDVMRDV